ncbi:CPXCG motif-containing cysteine-rich protein [Nevskia sp.]|uniref:CPXCG motif-containing cysteine-rich protein n=1 Tax=Nevskia sp. TaxID=1929292 RepID=UPI0025FB7894|nr:CPXCG motif-containing cysteine-rich protein [Nevskia sp.]
MREDVEVICPACHESIPLTVNPAKGSKTWEEECCVCDTPMVVRLVVDEDDEYTVEVEEVADVEPGTAAAEGLSETRVTCPACWEEIPLTIDLSAGSQTYSEDCSVCCRPMTVRVWVDDDGEAHTVDVEAESE